MVKTIQINENAHTAMKEKQIELVKKGIDMKFVDIATEAILAGIDFVGTE